MTYTFYIEFLHEKILSPEILGPSKLEQQGGEEDEQVLHEEGYPGVNAGGAKPLLLVAHHHVLAKQDVAGAQQGTEINMAINTWGCSGC